MPITVKDLATETGVAAHVVRYYARAGLLRPRRDPGNRYRLFRDADVTRLRFIRRAKMLGFTLKDIRQILRDADKGQSPCPRTRRIKAARLDENERNLKELIALHDRMKKAAKAWRRLPDSEPHGDSICRLIEDVTKDRGNRTASK